MEELLILPDDEDENNESDEGASPLINMVVSTYYKGTGIEQLTKKLEEYLESAPKNESQINFI